MSAPIIIDDESAAAAAVSVSGVTNMPVAMVRCNAMAWTDEAEGRLKVLVTRSDPVAGTMMVEEQAVPRARFTGTARAAEKRFMELKWYEKLWQAMSRVEKHKSIITNRAVERAAKRQCKKDEHQTGALLAKASDWSAHVFDPKCADSVTRKAALVEECLSEARALAKSKGEKLPWLECLSKGICDSGRLAAHLRRWKERYTQYCPTTMQACHTACVPSAYHLQGQSLKLGLNDEAESLSIYPLS
jgi:hypothetical protein